MAKTYPKRPLMPAVPNDAFLGFVSVEYQEATSQTFKAYSPVVLASGLLNEASSTITTTPMLGIVLEDATNASTTGTFLRVCPFMGDSTSVYGNFLGAAAADNVLAAADLGNDYQLAKSTTLLGTGKPGWYILDDSTNGCVKISSFRSDWTIPQSNESAAVAGDTNARVTATVLNALQALLV